MRIYCYSPWATLQIWNDGHYGPCCAIKIPLKSFPKDKKDIFELFNSKEMQAIRWRLVNGKVNLVPCSNCYHRNFWHQDDYSFSYHALAKSLPMYTSKEGYKEFARKYEKLNTDYVNGLLKVSETPLNYHFIVSQKCNLKCIMCSQNKIPRELPTYVFDALEEDPERINEIHIVGGEPFVSSAAINFIHRIEKVKLHGCVVRITTNGTLLNIYFDTLKNIENLSLTVSIEGVGHRYEKIRKGSNWNKIVANLMSLPELLRTGGYRIIMLNSIIMKSSYLDTLNILRLSSAIETKVNFFPVFGCPNEDISFFSNYTELEGVLKEIEYARRLAIILRDNVAVRTLIATKKHIINSVNKWVDGNICAFPMLFKCNKNFKWDNLDGDVYLYPFTTVVSKIINREMYHGLSDKITGIVDLRAYYVRKKYEHLNILHPHDFYTIVNKNKHDKINLIITSSRYFERLLMEVKKYKDKINLFYINWDDSCNLYEVVWKIYSVS